jgi:glutamate--cysteine ligase
MTQLLPGGHGGTDADGPPMLDGEPIGEADAEAYVSGICFKTGPPGRVGVELEWLVQDRADPTRRVPHDLVTAAASTAAVTCGTLSVEPGGQLEYSSAPGADLDTCVADTRADVAGLRAALTRAGLRLTGYGVDPHRTPQRVLESPRYAAMQEFFDRDGPAGRWMMTCTASVQLCLDAGTAEGPEPAGYRHRWRLAHAIGPVLVAAFANSPLAGGRPTGWRSTRQAVWARIDASRTAPALPDPVRDGQRPDAAWSRYALDARVLCVRRAPGRSWTAEPGLTFRGWIRRGEPGRPTRADLDYHLTTLFPPVRPRGYLELRMVDAQPGDGWVVPLAVAAGLLDDPAAGTEALAATAALWAGGADPWLRAARAGLADRGLAEAAHACFDLAATGLHRLGASPAVRTAVADFTGRYVHRGRSPADDLLEAIA